LDWIYGRCEVLDSGGAQVGFGISPHTSPYLAAVGRRLREKLHKSFHNGRTPASPKDCGLWLRRFARKKFIGMTRTGSLLVRPSFGTFQHHPSTTHNLLADPLPKRQHQKVVPRRSISRRIYCTTTTGSLTEDWKHRHIRQVYANKQLLVVAEQPGQEK
jgi:hypothetical protein